MAGIVDLVVWREAAALSVRIEAAAQRFTGPAGRAAAEQMIRAADSIAANIAEGYGRGVNRDGLRFLGIAHASVDELESHLRVAALKGRLPQAEADDLIGHTRRVGFLLRRYEQSVERRIPGR